MSQLQQFDAADWLKRWEAIGGRAYLSANYDMGGKELGRGLMLYYPRDNPEERNKLNMEIALDDDRHDAVAASRRTLFRADSPTTYC